MKKVLLFFILLLLGCSNNIDDNPHQDYYGRHISKGDYVVINVNIDEKDNITNYKELSIIYTKKRDIDLSFDNYEFEMINDNYGDFYIEYDKFNSPITSTYIVITYKKESYVIANGIDNPFSKIFNLKNYTRFGKEGNCTYYMNIKLYVGEDGKLYSM